MGQCGQLEEALPNTSLLLTHCSRRGQGPHHGDPGNRGIQELGLHLPPTPLGLGGFEWLLGSSLIRFYLFVF